MGGGGGKDTNQPSGSAALERFLGEYTEQTRSGRSTLFAQITEALKTGGVGARLPIVGKAVEASKAATSSAMRGTEETLARTGLTRTPWGQNVLAGQRLEGELAVSRIPTDMTQAFLAGTLPAFTGAPNTIVGGYSNLAATQTQAQISQNTLINDLFTSIFAAGGAIGGAAAGKPPVGAPA